MTHDHDPNNPTPVPLPGPSPFDPNRAGHQPRVPTAATFPNPGPLPPAPHSPFEHARTPPTLTPAGGHTGFSDPAAKDGRS